MADVGQHFQRALRARRGTGTNLYFVLVTESVSAPKIWLRRAVAISRAMLASADEQSIPIFHYGARGYPSGRDDVREYPLSLRNVEDLLAERGIEISHDGEVLVEPVWPDIRRRNPKEAVPEIAELAVDLHEDLIQVPAPLRKDERVCDRRRPKAKSLRRRSPQDGIWRLR
jgi:hypothetical protein